MEAPLKFLFAYLLVIAVGFAQEVEDLVSFLQIDQENFEQTIEDATLPLILDVNAGWCGPCQMFAPIFDEVSEEYKDEALFGKMDYDSQVGLAKKLGVSSLPTVLFFKPREKKPSMKSVGYMDKEEFEAKVKKFIGE
jgi:thioredoxin 1